MGIFDFFKRSKDNDRIIHKKPTRNRNSLAISIVKADLNRLNSITPGLGAKAISFVISGQNETVLSTISNGAYSEALEVGKQYAQHKATQRRRSLFSRMQPYDIHLVSRYAQVLAAAAPTDTKSLSGSKRLPLVLRLLFTDIFYGVDSRRNNYIGNERNFNSKVTPEIAFTLVEILGGETVDYFDAIYEIPSYWSGYGSKDYRKVIDIKSAVFNNPEATVKAGRRVNAQGRERLIRDITTWKALETSPFFEYVFECIGDGAKKVREAATSALKSVSAEKMEALAISELGSRLIGTRAAMVDMLATLGTPTALQALADHKGKEKAARVIAAIDTALAVQARTSSMDANADDKTAYTAIDGTRVEIPLMRRLQSGPFVEITPPEKKELKELIYQENEKIKKQIEESKRQGYKWHPPLISPRTAEHIIKAMAPTAKDPLRHYQYSFLFTGNGIKWLEAILDKQEPAIALKISLNKIGGIQHMTNRWVDNNLKTRLLDYLDSPDGDFRYLEEFEISHGREVTVGSYRKQHKSKTKQGSFLRYITADGTYFSNRIEDYPSHALWPYIAENLDVLDEAFGLRPQQNVKLSRTEAISMLTVLPKPPLRYFGSLLEAATGSTKAGRQEARDMLECAEDVNTRLVTLLQDTRQAIRAGAAEWMGERNNKDFIKPLKARLKKEKSELAKASILTALDRLGENLTFYIGPKALITEAEANIKKAKFDKLNWLGLDHLPNVKFKNGARVPDNVLKWWIYLAFKLKEPSGNKLFQLFLGQFHPDSAQVLSTWILDSWINYDTARPNDEDANKIAKQQATGRYNSIKRWYKDYTVEQAFADIKREYMSNYLNSGAASKGLLALTYRADPTQSAERTRNFLKNHGSRTSQASSLLSVLASKADPVSLQVVIAAATRLKQKGVQKFANELLSRVAEEKGWTMDELADRTIPTAGFNDEGILELPCGPDEKLYTGMLSEELTIQIRNPQGKVIKGLASTPDESTKASKKQLSTSRKELKQVVTMQSARLYEALCSERLWNLQDWKQNFAEHPIMRKLVERVIWVGLDADGNAKGSFRPTAEGDYTDSDDNPVKIETFSNFRLAHGAVMTEAQAKAWSAHLEDYEIKPLFFQFGRELKRLEGNQKNQIIIEDRKGWVSDTFTVRGVAAKLGYDRGEAMDGGYFNEYTKSFRSAGVIAVIEFSGNCLPEENVAAAMISLSFEKTSLRRGRGGALKLDAVPPVLLSECWNDYHAMAAKGAYDENWKNNMPWI